MVAEVGTEEEHFVRVFGLHAGCTRAQDRVDTSHAVADFPRSLKNIIGLFHFDSVSAASFRTPFRSFNCVGTVINLLLSDPTKGMYHTPSSVAQ